MAVKRLCATERMFPLDLLQVAAAGLLDVVIHGLLLLRSLLLKVLNPLSDGPIDSNSASNSLMTGLGVSAHPAAPVVPAPSVEHRQSSF